MLSYGNVKTFCKVIIFCFLYFDKNDLHLEWETFLSKDNGGWGTCFLAVHVKSPAALCMFIVIIVID